jgi:hypothetical protein
MRTKVNDPKRDQNYLPSHICEAFQTELGSLIEDLAKDGGFKERYLASEYFSKYCETDDASADVRSKAAISKWLAIEKRNLTTNERLLFDRPDLGYCSSEALIRKAREIVTDVLGSFDFDSVFARGRMSNGASTRVRRGPLAHIEKHGGKAHVSTTCLPYWEKFVEGTRLANLETEIQDASVMFTVPKNSEIDRVACKEPEINMFLQNCVGRHFKKCLRKYGIDLRDQTQNQRLAKSALNRGLATIDLSAASDSISSQLVIELLPVDWWFVLNDLRVHYVDIESLGVQHRLAMFSSMGNGFTFELETLIFYALLRAISFFSKSKGIISVYGDDIICPSRVAPRVQRTFFWFGFTVNSKKSHWTGEFRESCGKHYYGSLDVTPFYLREPVANKAHVIRLLNRLLVWDECLGSLATPKCAHFHRKWSLVIPRKLWGGQDPEDITSLVTGHRPASKLQAISGEILPFDGSAALDAWLTERSVDQKSTFHPSPFGFWWFSRPGELDQILRSSEDCLTFEPMLEKKRYKTVPNRALPYTTAWNPWLIAEDSCCGHSE